MQANLDPSAQAHRNDVIVVPVAEQEPAPPPAPVAPSKTAAAAQYRSLAFKVLVTDAASIVLALFLASMLRYGLSAPDWDFVPVMAIAPPLWLALFAGYGLYAFQRLEPLEEFRRLIAAVSIGIMIVVAVSFWSKGSFSRLWVGESWILSLVLVLASRRLWHRWVGRRRHAGRFTLRTLIVGTNEEGHHLAEVMSSEPLGFEPVGYVSSENGSAGAPRTRGHPVVGELFTLREAIRRTAADCVFVAASAMRMKDMPGVTRTARQEGVELLVTANLPEMLSSRLAPQSFRGIMALSLKPVRLTGAQAALKRFLDVAAACIGLILLAPIWLVVAIAVKTTSRGPILYRQDRVGRLGRRFECLKFRTMVRGANELTVQLGDRNEASGPLFKIRDDPRVTRIGRFLRRWSLDELPQLWNVLLGDMSLVGPRPPLPHEVEEYNEWHFDRLEVRPGITGLWQVSGRSNLSFDDYVRLDLFYIENWSPILDLYILLRTVPAVLRRTGAY